jgi:hypothetical protein
VKDDRVDSKAAVIESARNHEQVPRTYRDPRRRFEDDPTARVGDNDEITRYLFDPPG